MTTWFKVIKGVVNFIYNFSKVWANIPLEFAGSFTVVLLGSLESLEINSGAHKTFSKLRL